MISRAQRILFLAMLVAVVTMATILIRLRERTQDRLRALQVTAPVTAPAGAPPESVELLIPNDTDGTLLETRRSLPMPQDDSARARELLETLLHSFREPHSTHPLAPLGVQENRSSEPSRETGVASQDSGASQDLDEIFLMPIPQPHGLPPARGEMAVVDLSAAFGC